MQVVHFDVFLFNIANAIFPTGFSFKNYLFLDTKMELKISRKENGIDSFVSLE